MKNTATVSVETAMKSTSLTYAALAALAPSAPTVERIAVVADGELYDGEHRLSEYVVTIHAPEVPFCFPDAPRNRAERRAAVARARRGAPAKRR